MHDRTEIQPYLDRLHDGDSRAWSELIPLVYGQLRNQAHAVFRNQQNTLQATAVLHEALLDLLQNDLESLKFESPGRFFAFVSRVIRSRLQDHIRRRKSTKRGGGWTRSLNSASDEVPEALRTVDLVALHDVLEKLREFDERLWTVTELKFFCGLTSTEIADTLGVSASTVERDWSFAKAWLHKHLEHVS